jgi:hypothetical protein
MVAKNDITGDSIASRVNSKEYEDNFDRIFRKNKIASDKPEDGDQRLNNEGKLESYYGGSWNVKEL